MDLDQAPPDSEGPLAEYDRRVREGILREDEHQKSMNLRDFLKLD